MTSCVAHLNLLPTLPSLWLHTTRRGELSTALNNAFPLWAALPVAVGHGSDESSLRSLSLPSRVHRLSWRTPQTFITLFLLDAQPRCDGSFYIPSLPSMFLQTRGHGTETPGRLLPHPGPALVCLYPWKPVASRTAFLPSGLRCREGESAHSRDNICTAGLGGRCFLHWKDGFGTHC